MRLYGKPLLESNGYPWIGVVTLTTDATVRDTEKGPIFSAFGAFERAPKGTKDNRLAIGITTKFNHELAKKLIAFPKGTRLLVCGSVEVSEYWTKRKGEKTYEVVAEFVHDQHDYKSVEESQNGHANAYERDSVPDDDFGGTTYDPDW